MSDFYPHFVQPAKGKTITTNTTSPAPTTPVEPPKSNLAITSVALLILGFAIITSGLVIPPATVYLAILGIAMILSANVVAILSLRELS